MKRPAFQFYPGDWLRATELRSCSVGARGLWIDMICLMHEGTPYGHLKVNRKAITGENLARMVGATPGEAAGWLAELEDAGVFSRDEDGNIYSRRMVRDEETRALRAASGKEGGNPKLVGEYNEPGYVYAAARASDGAVKIGISKTPSKRMYKIRAQFPGDTITMLDSALVSDMGAVEAALHGEFAAAKSGEWFALDQGQRDRLLTLVCHLKVNPMAIPTPASASASASAKTEDTARKRSAPVGLKSFLENLKASGDQFLPEDDSIWTYAESVGLSDDMLRLAFLKFKDRYLDKPKRYTDWRRVFRESVKDRWMKLWYLDATSGKIQLTTDGRLALEQFKGDSQLRRVA